MEHDATEHPVDTLLRELQTYVSGCIDMVDFQFHAHADHAGTRTTYDSIIAMLKNAVGAFVDAAENGRWRNTFYAYSEDRPHIFQLLTGYHTGPPTLAAMCVTKIATRSTSARACHRRKHLPTCTCWAGVEIPHVFKRMLAAANAAACAITAGHAAGITLLHLACNLWLVDDVSRFLLMGADPNALAAGMHYSPLHCVLADRAEDNAIRMRIIRLLLQAGADANAHTRSGKTPLYYAISYGWMELVELLLSYGADANAYHGDDAVAALPRAIMSGEFDIALLLLNGKCTPDDMSYETWLRCITAARSADQYDIVNMLSTSKHVMASL